MEENKTEQRYKGERGRQYHQKRLIPDSAYQWVGRLRAKKISPDINENDTVLEYGVGAGWNLAKLTCRKKIGFDLSEHLRPIVQSHGIEFIKETESIEDSSKNVVICHHVIENVSSPLQALTEIRRMLCKNGKLLLFVPFERGRRYYSFNSNDPSHHLYSWNVQTLGNLIKDMNFSFIQGKIQEFGYDRFAAIWATKLHLGERGYRFIRKAVHLIKPCSEVYIIAEKD